jgi:Protein of unknown function (DUF2785)
MDKAFWHSILAADGAVPKGHTVASLTPELLSLLGSTDPELRDGVAYVVLATWLARDRYTSTEVWAIAERLMENLSVGLGEEESDHIFLRSFSALMLAEIVHRDNQGALLDERQAHRLLDEALAYLAAEQDLRGYVPAKGWAHAVAHAADLLWVLARSRHLHADSLKRILEAIAVKAAPPGTHIYLYNENQRLARAALGAIGRDLVDMGFLTSWIDRLARPDGRAVGVETFFDGLPPAIADPADLALLRNTTQFFGALQFHLAHDENPPAITPILLLLLVEALRPMQAC